MQINLEWINDNETIIYFLKIIVISIFTFYTSIKLLNIKQYWNTKYKVIFCVSSVGISIFSKIMDKTTTMNINSIVYIIFCVSIIFSILTKYNFGYSILVIAISLSINQILFVLSSILEFGAYKIFQIKNEYVNFIIILITYFVLINLVFKIKRIKNGILILKKNKYNNYFNLLILNISVVILFSIILLSSYEVISNRRLVIGLIIITIILLITIQKSLQLYYKQRMLVKDLEETKKELEEKKAEVKELEKENLNFSKISHTIAHRH